MDRSRVGRLFICALFSIWVNGCDSKPGGAREGSPVFVSSYSKVSRSGYVADANQGNQSANATSAPTCCGGDFKPSAIVYYPQVQTTKYISTTSEAATPYTEVPVTEQPNADESEESRGYRNHPSRVLQFSAPSSVHVVDPPQYAQDRYAAKPIPKQKPSKMSYPRPSRAPYQADFSDTMNSYQPPQPSKDYPPDGLPSSYNPGPPKTSYNPAPPDTSYGSPSLDLPDSPTKQGPRIPYAPDYLSSQEVMNIKIAHSAKPAKPIDQGSDFEGSKMKYGPPDMSPSKEVQKPMKMATSPPENSYYDYNPEEYPHYPSEVMTPPKREPPLPPGMNKPGKHNSKHPHHSPHHDDGEISFEPPDKLYPKEPKIPQYPPEPGQMHPHMHGPGPQWVYKPETNEYTYPPEEKEKPKMNKDKSKKEKPSISDIEYIDDEEFPHYFHHHGHHSHHDHHHKEKPMMMTTTEKPMEDHDSEDRQKKPYSYYYLGRKLWFVPLYFSVYFIIYVTALILKSIARHKITYPTLTEEGKNEDRSGRNIYLEDTTDAVYKGIDIARSKYSS